MNDATAPPAPRLVDRAAREVFRTISALLSAPGKISATAMSGWDAGHPS